MSSEGNINDGTLHLQALPKSSTALSLNDSIMSDGSRMEMLEFQLIQKKEKRNELLQRIAAVRTKRQLLGTQNKKLNQLTDQWMKEHNQALMDRANSISNYSSKIQKIQAVKDQDDALRDINVLQDVFHIWHRGSFSTINGLRLGMCSAPLVEMAELTAAVGQMQLSSSSSGNNNNNAASSDSSFWGMNLGGGIGYNNNSNGSGNNNTKSNASKSLSTSNASENDVPWHEINAAVGMVALLIQILQTKLRIHHMSRYVILPRGSTTRISSRKTQQEWELYYVPSTFQFFARRNWNAALNILGFCIFEIVREINRLKKHYAALELKKQEEEKNGYCDGSADINDAATISRKSLVTSFMIPFEVTLEDDWNNERIGKVKVGGLDIAYNGDEIEWTRVMKYVAIDLKLMVAFISCRVSDGMKLPGT